MGVKVKDINPLCVTHRDLEILAYLGSHGFATRAQIFHKFWSGSPKSNAHHRRIRALLKYKLIEPIVGDQGCLALKLTKKGVSYLRKTLGDEVNVTEFRRRYRSQFQHDKTVQEVLKIFEESDATLQTETEKDFLNKIRPNLGGHQSSYQKDQIPDGLVLLRTPNGYRWVAIEVELTRKSGNRYRRILANHLTSKNWGATIYFTRGEKLPQVLSDLCRYCKVRDPAVKFSKTLNAIYFIDIDRFLEDKAVSIFKSEEDQFSLESLSKKNLEKVQEPSLSAYRN